MFILTTLFELLNNEKLNMLNLVTENIQNKDKITGAIMLDNPEMVKWMREGEMLLTTGYLLKDSPKTQQQLIYDLSKSKAGALVIKLRRYFETTPSSMIDLANKLNFPILEVPHYMSLSELSEIINKQIYFEDKIQDNSRKNLSELLFKLIEDNADSQTIINLGESFTKSAFVLLDNNMKTINVSNSFSKFSKTIPRPNDLFFSAEDKHNYINYFSNNENTYLDLSSSNLFPKFYSMIFTIKFDEILLGYLLCISDENFTSKIEPDINYNKIRMALSILLLKESTSVEYNNHKSDILLESLFNNDVLSDIQIEKISSDYKLPIDSSYICCLVSFTKNHKIEFSNEWIGKKNLERERITSYWDRYSTGICKLFIKGNHMIILLQIDKDLESAIDLSKEFCRDIKSLLIEYHLNKGVYIGIGNISNKLKNINNSYYQAKKAIEAMINLNSPKRICTFDECLIYQLLSSSDYINKTLTERLTPLINHDIENNTELLLTFEAYLNNNQNITLTAESLFIHRNTLYYRLERIIELLNIDFKNYNSVLIYQLALESLKTN